MEEQNLNNIEENNSEEKKPISELEKCQKERDEYLEGWKRAKADFINFKKDEDKRFEAMVKFGQEATIRDLITVLDSFDLALISLASNKEQTVSEELMGKGFYLIRAQLEDLMKKHGLERMKISVGEKFDPSVHDAISVEDSDKESGTIIEEVEKGYTLNGKLIRAARVKVAK